MYEINFHTKISDAWFTGLSIVFSSFSGFRSIWEYEIKFKAKGLGRKSTNFFAYENFFLYSTKNQLISLSAFWREKQGCFLGYFFVWVPIFDPTLLQYFIEIPHIIFLPVFNIS